MGMLNSGHESMKRRDAWTAGQVDELFEGLGSKTARVRYGAAKGLRTVSEQAPDLLYPRWDSLVRMLDDDNAFMRWGAQQILATSRRRIGKTGSNRCSTGSSLPYRGER